MSQAELTATPSPPLGRLLASAPLFWTAVFAIVATTLAAAQRRVPQADLAFYLYAARRLIDGATLYRDIGDMNPPLIIWLNVPAVLAARLLDIPEILAYRLLATTLAGASLLLCHRLARDVLWPEALVARRYLLLLLCFALFPLAWEDFGQREYFVLALLLPYLFTAVARVQGAGVPAALAAGTGLLAGVGVALKPHFVIVVVVLEAFRRLRAPLDRWRITPELAGGGAFLGLYGLAIFTLTPDYLPLVTLLGPAYTSFMRQSVVEVTLLASATPLVLFTLFAFLALRRSARRPLPWDLFAGAILACYASAVVQHKGLRYHYYPAFALAFVLLGLIAATARRKAASPSAALYGRTSQALIGTIVIFVFGSAVADALGTRAAARAEFRALAELAASVRARANGRPIGVLSYTMNSAFPLVNEAGTPLASRFPCLWLLAATYWDSLATGGALRYHAPDSMPRAERFMWDAVRDDLVQANPELIVVLRPARDVPAHGLRRLHPIAYFARQSELADLFSRYQLVERQGEYLIYQRVAANAARTGPAPSIEASDLDAPRSAVLGDLDISIVDQPLRVGLLIFGSIWVGALILDRRKARPGMAAERDAAVATGADARTPG